MERLKADLGLPILDSTDHTLHELFAGIRPVPLVEMHRHKVNALIVTHLPLRESRTPESVSEHTWLHHIESFLTDLLAVRLVA